MNHLLRSAGHSGCRRVRADGLADEVAHLRRSPDELQAMPVIVFEIRNHRRQQRRVDQAEPLRTLRYRPDLIRIEQLQKLDRFSAIRRKKYDRGFCCTVHSGVSRE